MEEAAQAALEVQRLAKRNPDLLREENIYVYIRMSDGRTGWCVSDGSAPPDLEDRIVIPLALCIRGTFQQRVDYLRE